MLFPDRSALLVASELANPSVVEVLVEHKANIEAKDDEGWTPLVHALMGTTVDSTDREQYLQIAKYLLEHNANVETKDFEGMTPLMLLSGGHDVAQNLPLPMEFLLEHKANIEAKDNEGMLLTVHVHGGCACLCG